MITAHLPSGYVLGRVLGANASLAMGVVVLGAIFPDFDLAWFYWVDERAFHHHRYWVHAPWFWVMVGIIGVPTLAMISRKVLRLGLLFMCGVFLHILLDSIAGGIMWLWPWVGTLYQLVTVQPTHSHFILSFMAHWTFLLEIAIWVTALLLIWPRANGPRDRRHPK
ncbi:metal-dependent hydrolase [Amylibacter marinus]|uniref:Metal-dependent hydrolase n=1 Tax=Amylibacter marinus TaxID=1475483 RepID=A0ABQ5VTV3_9RHOB|nr:metal-dependent hydrolase [Amylibacter marinus]GLQ34865.1 metal-dependent hydrolase [Amylibacter marinus]